MSMHRIYTLLAALIFVSGDISAQDHPVNQLGKKDYILIWHCGGMGARRHGRIACLTAAGLSYDTAHAVCFIPKDINELTLTAKASKDALTKLQDLPAAISKKMLETREHRYGRQAVDGGNYHVLGMINGQKYSWSFTGALDRFDDDVRPFATYLYHAL